MTKKKDAWRNGEIDVVQLAGTVWRQRSRVVRVAGIIAAVGLLAAIFGEVKYRAGFVIAPQTGRDVTGAGVGNLAGIAAIAGIDIGNTGSSSGGLSPKLYPMVVASVPFQKELMYTPIEVPGREGTVTLVDYFTRREMRPFSPAAFLADYTIGLPRTVINAVRKARDESRSERDVPATGLSTGVHTLSAREHECMMRLSRLVETKVNEQNGYVSLTVTMPEARAAAQVAYRAQVLLQEYVTRFKVQKVQADLEFIEERYNEVKVDFETKQVALAAFQDANRDITSARARTRENRLENEYSLAFSLYSELAGQLEQARIKVKEDTPVFTVIEPVTVPVEKAAPRRTMIVLGSLVIGLLIGVGIVVAASALRNLKKA